MFYVVVLLCMEEDVRVRMAPIGGHLAKVGGRAAWPRPNGLELWPNGLNFLQYAKLVQYIRILPVFHPFEILQ